MSPSGFWQNSPTRQGIGVELSYILARGRLGTGIIPSIYERFGNSISICVFGPVILPGFGPVCERLTRTKPTFTLRILGL